MTHTITLKLPDMTCGHCEGTVTRTVRSVDPAARLSIDLAKQIVTIESSQPPKLFEEALTEEGYPPQAQS